MASFKLAYGDDHWLPALQPRNITHKRGGKGAGRGGRGKDKRKRSFLLTFYAHFARHCIDYSSAARFTFRNQDRSAAASAGCHLNTHAKGIRRGAELPDGSSCIDPRRRGRRPLLMLSMTTPVLCSLRPFQQWDNLGRDEECVPRYRCDQTAARVGQLPHINNIASGTGPRTATA